MTDAAIGSHNVLMEPRKAYRALDGRKLAGVALGLARHLGIQVKYVRLAFILTALLGSGAGVIIYLALWALLPMDPEGAADSAPGEDAADPGWVILLSALTGLALLALIALGFVSIAKYMLPLALGVIGIIVVWSRADEVQRAKWRADAADAAHDAAADAQSYGTWRVVAGTLAVFIAIVGIVLSSIGVTAMVQGFATTLLLTLGSGLVAYPWLHEQWNRLVDERGARIRADERAQMAARIHDSVLQTLTLVQKHADDPQRVQQLARAEERELRDWLYGEPKPGESITAALAEASQEVEERHGVSIDVVTVGDAPVDSRVEALLSAAQEAMVNAAKHAGVSSVQVFAEVEPELISVFVRDRGQGFVRADVPDDRAGVRDSIEARMQRAGGTAQIRSVVGDGTEIALTLPRVVE